MLWKWSKPVYEPEPPKPEKKTRHVVTVHFYDDSCTTYHLPADGFPMPPVNFMRGFVEIEEGIFLNAQDIKRIETSREEIPPKK